MNLTIQQKLITMGVAVILTLAVILIQNISSSSEIGHLHSMHGDIKELENTMLQLRRNEKDFLMRRDIKYRETFANNSQKAIAIANNLLVEMESEDLSTSRIKDIIQNLSEYRNIFDALVNKWEVKGLNKDAGHYGSLRKATHNMEEEIKKLGDLSAHVKLLTLRRHEKDFILRNDEKYVSRLQEEAQQLSREVTGMAANYLNAYIEEFNDFVAISKEIGLDSKSGLRGAMRSTVHKVEEDLEEESAHLESYIEERTSSVTTLNIIIMVIISIVLIAAIAMISKQIIKPLNSIAQELTSIRKSNDLSRRVEESNDEIGTVAKNFNIFMAHFQSLIGKINQTVDSLSIATETVSSSVSKTSNGIMEQSQESNMVAAAVTELGASAYEIANNAQSTTERTERATANARDGNAKLKQTVSNVNGLSKQLVDAGALMMKLQEKSNGITAVLDVIRGIAEQTNLLALNAAIEAARAGEQGRGFAVVADEVRTLAVRTQESTSEITSIIDELQSSTTSIADTVAKCKERGIQSSDMATEAGEILNLIVEDMNAISSMTAEIATAVHEQSSVILEIDQNIVRIRDFGVQVAADSKENSKASEKVAELAKLLHKEASIFKV